MTKHVCFSLFLSMIVVLMVGLAVGACDAVEASSAPPTGILEPTSGTDISLWRAQGIASSTNDRYIYSPAALPAGARPGYLIVAPENLMDDAVFDDFRAFKRGLGFDVYLKSIEWVTSTSPGVDDLERLRNYLQIAYEANTLGPRNIRYCLLVGNQDDIPYREVYPRWPDQRGVTLSDWYFADLTGDWDSNGNGQFGEGMLLDAPTDEADLHYEVAIGRLPFSHAQNVRRALATIMAFERDGGACKMHTIQAGAFMQFAGLTWSPKDNSDGSYHANGAAFGEVRIGVDTDNAVLMEESWNDILQPAGMSRTRLFETSLNPLGVPHSSYTADHPLNVDNLIDVWNEEKHGLVNLAGHGNEWGIYQSLWNEEIDNDNTINQPTRPIDTGDGELLSRSELTQSAFLHANDLDLLDPPNALAPVVVTAGCGTANAEHGNGLGVTSLALGKASAFFGSLGTVGFQPAWASNTGSGVTQDILLRLNRLLLTDYPRVGDATYQTTMQLFDETPGEPRGRALVKQVVHGDPAMSYWGEGAEFDSPWPMFRHDIRNSGLTSYNGPALGEVRWTFQLNPVPFTNGVPSPIVGPDGTIYAGNVTGVLYAINPDGTEKWRFHAGGAISAGPILTVGGTLYFRAEDGYLYAVTDDGDLRWRAPMELFPGTAGPTPGHPPFSNSPRITPDGTVLALATIDMDGGFSIYNGYRPTGERIWAEQAAAFGSAGTPAISPDGSIYYAYWNGTLNTGFDLGAPTLGSAAIGDDGSIFVGNINGRLYSINSDMDENWHYDVVGQFNDIDSSPAVGEDGSVYFGASDKYVYALNSDGTLRWKYFTYGPVDSSPALDETAVYVVGGADGKAKLYALDRSDGDLRWSVSIGGRSVWGSSPAIGFGSMVYVVSQDGRLFAIGPVGPLPPSDALAQAVSPFEIDISWRDNSSDEAGFQLERRKGWSGPYKTIATLGPNKTFYSDKIVFANQTYFYRVRAQGSAFSGYTNNASAHTPPPAPETPSNLTTAAESSYAIGLQWNPLDTDALGVGIYRSSTAAGPFRRVGLVAGDVTQFSDVNHAVVNGGSVSTGHPRPGQNYFYRLRAFNETGKSLYSAAVKGKTLGLNLAPPTDLQAVVHDFSYVELTWQGNASQAVGYVMERSSNDQPGYEVIALLEANAASYEDRAVWGGYHTYRIRAFNTTDNSSFAESNTVHVYDVVWESHLPIVWR